MTIFRYSLAASLVPLAGFCCAASAAQGAAQKVDACSNINPMVQRRCVGQRIERKDRVLAKVYPTALAAVGRSFAKYGRSDIRTHPKHLRQSHAAWGAFVKNDCAVRSAFGGGSNMAIEDRYLDCYEGELDKRLDFLRKLSDDSYGL
jgi:uncharacterized protein YecT (DUF1311 family)